MNRLFPRVVSAAVVGSALGLGLLGAACSPNNSTPPGAPVLTTFSIVDPFAPNGPAFIINVTADTVDCAADIVDTQDCDPDATPVCRYMAKSYCHCDAKPEGDPSIMPEMPKSNGTATCTYSPTWVVFATFDRLIDIAPLDPDGGQTDLVTFAATPAPAVTVAAATDYWPNGHAKGFVFSPPFTGWPLGPSLHIVPAPATPAGAAVKLTLDSGKVRAKDGKTGFVGKGGFLVGGALVYQTQPLSASITVPQPATDDAGVTPTTVPPDSAPVTIAFNNAVDATVADHIHVNVGTTAYTDITIDTSALPTVTITPKTTWTASTTFDVVVDADAADVTGSKLGTDATGTFTTGAM